MAENVNARMDDAFVLKELSPNFAVLDLGCTRAMVSRVAVTHFIQYLRYVPNGGITFELLPTDAHFNFANSETARCHEKIRLHFACWKSLSTDFEIVEQGDVPFLFSLGL